MAEQREPVTFAIKTNVRDTLKPAVMAVNTRMYRIEQNIFIDFIAVPPSELDRMAKLARASTEAIKVFETEGLLFSRVAMMKPTFEGLLSQARLIAEAMNISWGDIASAQEIQYQEEEK